MSSAFHAIGKLFGAGGQQQQTPTPTIINQAAPTPPPIQSPVGNADTNKSSGGPSFLSAGAVAPGQGQSAGRTLLGQ